MSKAKFVHGDRYDYSEAVYTGARNKIKIICSDHGAFFQNANGHTNGQGCRHCARIAIVKSQTHTTESFIEKAKSVHGDKYDYSMSDYIHNKKKIIIICKVHGEFLQAPSGHLTGQGCQSCGCEKSRISRLSSTDEFIKKANIVHAFKYEYTDVIYDGHTKKVIITCLDHGNFNQTPEDHLSGRGCPHCAKLKAYTYRLKSTEQFIKEASAKHNGRYDYSLTKYIKSNEKVDIICKEHGVFQQIAADHLIGCGCKLCQYRDYGLRFRMSTDEFVAKSRLIYGDRFDYSKTEYVKSTYKLTITCKEHGDFDQIPADHLSGHTCPACSWTTIAISTGEQELYDYVAELVATEQADRKVIKPYEIDCLIPSKKLGIEYCGIYYHSDKFKPNNYHLDKLEKSTEAGYGLMQVFCDEWNGKKDIVKSIIANRLGCSSDKVYARKTSIAEVSQKESELFLNDNHIQGYVNANIRVGLYSNNELVMLATFSANRSSVSVLDDGWYELVRLCAKKGTSIVGGFSKLLKWFISNHNPTGIKTYCDKRYFNGSGYEAVGFEKTHETVPSYYYVKSGMRYSRYLFQKHKMAKILKTYDATLSERENMIANNYVRVYDCGLIVYKLTI